MNPFSDLFRRPPTVQECALPPAPERRVNDDGRTYLVVAHYPATATSLAAKVSYELPISEVAERVRLSLLAGATHIDVEPEWPGARLVAS